MAQSGRLSWPQARTAVVECVILAVACLITYWLVTSALSRVYSLSRDDDLLGGMWAVLATIFVLRDSFGKSVTAAVSRMAATFVSFVLCLIYLAFLPFHAWALAVLVGASALAVMLLGRPGDAVTAGITTAVIMVVAAVSPQHAWQQPILRLADTVVGVIVGAVAAWTGIRLRRFLPDRSVPPDPAKVKVDLSERTVVRRSRPCAATSPMARLPSSPSGAVSRPLSGGQPVGAGRPQRRHARIPDRPSGPGRPQCRALLGRPHRGGRRRVRRDQPGRRWAPRCSSRSRSKRSLRLWAIAAIATKPSATPRVAEPGR
jgi:hypothetical protein